MRTIVYALTADPDYVVFDRDVVAHNNFRWNDWNPVALVECDERAARLIRMDGGHRLVVGDERARGEEVAYTAQQVVCGDASLAVTIFASTPSKEHPPATVVPVR